MAKKKYFEEVDTKVSFPELEEKIIKFWKKEKIFEKSVEMRPDNKKWTFLDGPPFITGLPHYGSLLSSIPKDLFPRYKTMKGFRVRRVWGWDCHGLPAENKVENKLGLESKRDIEEKVGVKKFIQECKAYVSETSSEWEWYIDHIGRWVDFKNAYKTMDKDYMESVMWVFKNMYDKNHIYKGLRVSLYCPHCETPISNFEVAMDSENYKELTEPGTTYKYELEDENGTFLLAWSTTPWNKIATPALAVNPEMVYVKVKQNNENYVLAKDTLEMLKDDSKYEILEEFKGKKLVGKKFIPHYDYYKNKAEKNKKIFEVVAADFVSGEEGTGVVTLAVYGEEDLEIMREKNIHMEMHVEDNGHIKRDVPKFAGMYYLKANKEVDKDLEERGLVYKKEPVTHSIPHCWRCGTRLFHNPQNAWYVDVQKLKPAMKENNEKVNWVPDHFKYGRFLKSMEAAPDWCISRSRYWGSPVPVWECECGERFVPGSIDELVKASGQKIDDLHKPEIDDVTVECKRCGKTAKRVPEVLDSWIEAGSAPFAERHFPFDDQVRLEDFFPPDFIVEYTGQIRAWFYVLHVIATALYESNAFKNVVVTGVILGTDGRKMSKNFGNYPDPKKMLEKHGGDALRLYLMASPVMKGEDVLISEEDYRNHVKVFLLPYWNVYNFFVTYANIHDWKPEDSNLENLELQNTLDRWVVSRFKQISEQIEKAYEGYDTQSVVQIAKEFLVNDLSGWYVRRSRNRVGFSVEEEDRSKALQVLWLVLLNFTKIIAPLTPFTTEKVFKNLTKDISVHLTDWPEIKIDTDEDLLEEMKNVRDIVEKIHKVRKEKEIAVKQPLNKAMIKAPYDKLSESVLQIAKSEVNVKEFEWQKDDDLGVELDTEITKELEEEAKARRLIRKIQKERKKMGMEMDEKVNVKNQWIPEDKDFLEKVKTDTQTKNLQRGEFEVKKI